MIDDMMLPSAPSGQDGSDAIASVSEQDAGFEDADSLSFYDQHPWIADLIHQDPTSMPTMFPYYIPTGFSVGQQSQSRRLSGSTLMTATTNAPPFPGRLEQALESLKIGGFLQLLHRSHLLKRRPSFRDTQLKDSPVHLHDNKVTSKAMEDPPAQALLRRHNSRRHSDNGGKKRWYKKMFHSTGALEKTSQAVSSVEAAAPKRNQKSTGLGGGNGSADPYLVRPKSQGKIANVHEQVLMRKTKPEPNQPEEAAIYLHKALEMLQQLLHSNGNAALDIGVAFFLLEKSLLCSYELKVSLILLFQTVSVFWQQSDKSDCHTQLRDTLDIIARAYCLQNDYDLARKHLREGRASLPKDPPDCDHSWVDHENELVANMLIDLGDHQVQKGKTAQTIDCYVDSIAIAQHAGTQLGPNNLQAEASIALGDLYCLENQEEQAIQCYQEIGTMQIASELAKHVALKKAILFFQQENVASALEEYHKLVGLCQNPSCKLEEDMLFDGLLSSGVCYYVQGNTQQSKIFYKEAIQMAYKPTLFDCKPDVRALLKSSEAQLIKSRLGRVMGRIDWRVRGHNSRFPEKTSDGAAASAIWYYFLENDPFQRKVDGWYQFDIDLGVEIEAKHQAFMADYHNNMRRVQQEPRLARLVLGKNSS